MTTVSTKNHSFLRSIAWEPEKPAERLNDSILMSRGTSNAYVITCEEGDVVVNTGTPYQGGRNRERFEELLGRPLKVSHIVFTQSHPDHIGGWAAFADEGVQTVVQREFPRISDERKLMAPYFQPRSQRVLKSLTPKKEHVDAWYTGTKDPEPLTLFADNYAFTVAGRRFELLSIPSGETLDSLAVWLPGDRTLFIGNWMGAIHGALPNFYTARGDRDRSIVGFLREMDMLISLRPELLITGHDEPVRGEQEVQQYLGKIRDAVRYIHDETVKGMNEYKDMWTLMQSINLPDHLQTKPGRGPVAWYVRAVWEEYTGWFRAEFTSELYSTPAYAIWPELAKMAGGTTALVSAAQRHSTEGELVKAMHFIEIALKTEPQNRQVRETEMVILKQLVEDNGGADYDRLGWLENAIDECQAVFDNL